MSTQRNEVDHCFACYLQSQPLARRRELYGYLNALARLQLTTTFPAVSAQLRKDEEEGSSA